MASKNAVANAPAHTIASRQLDRAGIVEIYDALASIKMAFDEPMHRWKATALRRQFKDVAEPIIETRDDVSKRAPTVFQEAREALCRKFAAKNKDGAPIIANYNYLIASDHQSAFDAAHLALRAEHKETLDAFDAEVKKVNEFLQQLVDVPITHVRLNLSWFNKTTPQEIFEVLFDYIDDDTPEGAKK